MVEDGDIEALRDAARVHLVSGKIRAAVADLAVRPLDEDAASRMRQLLQGEHAAARTSMRRLQLVDPEDER